MGRSRLPAHALPSRSASWSFAAVSRRVGRCRLVQRGLGRVRRRLVGGCRVGGRACLRAWRPGRVSRARQALPARSPVVTGVGAFARVPVVAAAATRRHVAERAEQFIPWTLSYRRARILAMLPSAQCDCGQPWGAHELRCPRPKHRGVGRVIALAVTGGFLLQVLFVVALVFVSAGLLRPTPTMDVFHVAPTGPIQPRIRACEEFYAWQGTHNPALLNQAVADAYGSRVPWQFATRFRADLTGLRDSVRKRAHSRTAISFEDAVQHHCKLLTGGTPHFRAQVRSAVAQFSRPGTATGRSAGQVPESGQSWNAPSMTH